ncbi:flavodoxin domain-containing protein [Ornithinibacillus caprae]|uniref:flavodoxin domain-containing protein n=1 Tax=Ornithinibacillus caprae TaxID=2678566 RepID=UPI0012D94000|nr:flavodoxin domain-containing protein [Ornithinibacillus caprae]
MNTIIIYATKHGTVEKAVSLLKRNLKGNIIIANVNKHVPSLEIFDTVIIGGSIYYGKVQKELTQYMKKNSRLLLTKRLGLFLCAGHPNPQQRKIEMENAFPKEILEHALLTSSPT